MLAAKYYQFLLALALTYGVARAAELQGTVQWNGLPVPGATVSATEGGRRLITVTDEEGKYTLDTLTPGTWVVEVEMFGFETAKREIAVTEGNGTVDWTLQLGGGPARVAAAKAPSPPRAQRGRGERRGGARPADVPAAGFEQVGVNQTTDGELLPALTQPQFDAPTPDAAMSASESFLVTGSTSRGLQVSPQEEAFAFFRPEGGPGGGPGGGMFGGPGGFGGPNGGVPGQPGMGAPGGDGEPRAMPGSGAGPGMGPRMGPGGRGMGGQGGPGGRGGPGMGRGGGGAGGGRGGFGGPGMGRGGPGGRPGQRPGAVPRVFGNRANRGRDTIRGGATFSLRNSALDARPFSLTGQKVEKPSYSQARFSLMLGGTLQIPKLVKDDKTFFFLNYSGSRARNPYDAVATLPTAAERSGDFSVSPGVGALGIIDPLSGLPFSGNRIPTSRINGAAKGLLDFFPLPNQPGLVRNYQFVTSAGRDSDTLGVRLGRSLGTRDRIAGSYNLRANDGVNVQPFAFRDTSEGRGQSADLSWIHTFRRGLLNMVRLNFNRNRNDLLPFFAYGENVAAALGIAGTSSDPINYGPPNLNFTNYGALTDGSPVLRRDQTVSIGDSLTWVRGSHTWQFGGDYRRTQNNSRTDQNGRGTFTFSGLATSAFNEQGQPLAGSGLDFADFLLGFPQSSSIRYGSSDVYLRGASYSLFAQDDWRVRSNLTLNWGLRYEFQSPLWEKYDRMANLDVAPGFTAVSVVTPGTVGAYSGEFERGLIDPDRNNFGPRVSFAWRPWAQRRAQVRGGYGVYHNASVYNQAASRLAQQPPFARTTQLVTSTNRSLTLADGFTGAAAQQITNTFAVDRGYRTGYAQTWSLSVQQELPASLVMELGYLGTKGTRLDIQRLPNRAAPGSPLTAEQRRQIGNAVGFTFDSSEGNSIYHAGQVRVARRFRSGFSANLLYTWSKSIDNASTFGGGGAVVVQNDRDLSAERGLSTFDRRHTLNLFWVYTSPFGNSASVIPMTGAASKLLRNWSITGGITAQSGSPLTARVLGNVSDTAGTGAVGSGRADATGLPIDSGDGFFNLLAFGIPPSNRYGNAARNTIPGPGLFNLNASIGRNFPLGERRMMEFRVEGTNVTNRVSYTRVGTTVNASDYGLATNAAGMRTMQASLRFRF